MKVMTNNFAGLLRIKSQDKMLCFLWIFAFSRDISSLMLLNGRKVKPGSPKLLASWDGEPSWFYIRVKNKNKLEYLSRIANTPVGTSNYINNHWYVLFLNSSQRIEIETDPSFDISQRIESDQYRHTDIDSDQYLINVAPGYTPNNAKRIYKDYYITKMKPNHDSNVFSYSKVRNAQLLNRWATGALQSEFQNIIYDPNNFVLPERPIFDHGLHGENEIVTMIDSGLDYKLCQFKDSHKPVPINKIDKGHRKIVRFDAFADTSDGIAGHGTHVAGTLFGKAECFNCSGSYLNGHAPEAKLYFVDAGLANQPNELITHYSFEKVLENAKEIGSKVMSNSWGYQPDQIEFRPLFDKITYENPEILMVFGGGNSRRMFDIYTPGGNKNCLSIGGSKGSNAISLNSDKSQVFALDTTEFKEKIKWNEWSESLLKLYKADPIYNYTKQPVIIIEDKIPDDKINVKWPKSYVCITNPTCELINAVDIKYVFAIFINSSIKCNKTNAPVFEVSKEVLDSLNKTKIATVYVDFNASTSHSVAEFNSGGPSELGLLKPDLLAPGYEIVSTLSSLDSESQCSAFRYLKKSGTSMAVPAVSASAVLIRQYLREKFPKPHSPSGVLLRAMLVNSAHPRDMKPNIRAGNGNIILDSILSFEESSFKLKIADNCYISSGEEMSATVKVTQKDQQINVVLAWNDPPLNSESLKPLYALLNLIVVSPSGKIFTHEDERVTQPKIHVPHSEIGEYSIKVQCPNLLNNIKIMFAVSMTGAFDSSDMLVFSKSKKRFLPSCWKSIGFQCEYPLHLFQGLVEIKCRVPSYFYLEFPRLKKNQVFIVNMSSILFKTNLIQLEISLDMPMRFGGSFLYFEQIKKYRNIYRFSPINNPELVYGRRIFFTFFEGIDKYRMINADSYVLKTGEIDFFNLSDAVSPINNSIIQRIAVFKPKKWKFPNYSSNLFPTIFTFSISFIVTLTIFFLIFLAWKCHQIIMKNISNELKDVPLETFFDTDSNAKIEKDKETTPFLRQMIDAP